MGCGVALAGLLGGAAGIAISIHDGPNVGGTASDAGNLALFLVTRQRRPAMVHFLGVYAMQALPLQGSACRGCDGCQRQACGLSSAPRAG